MARQTLLERIVEERAGQAVVGTASPAIDRAAEELAREALADETFRRTIRELVRRRSQEPLDELLHNGGRDRRRRPRRRIRR